jgi:hypothetical protein
MLSLQQCLEAGKTADDHCDTTLNRTPQGQPRDLRMNALSVGDDNSGSGDTDDEYTETQHDEQAEFLLL